MQALGIVSAYQSAMKSWKASGCKGEAPKLNSCMYRIIPSLSAWRENRSPGRKTDAFF